MEERKYTPAFIPCGDALEKMALFADETPERPADGEEARESTGETD